MNIYFLRIIFILFFILQSISNSNEISKKDKIKNRKIDKNEEDAESPFEWFAKVNKDTFKKYKEMYAVDPLDLFKKTERELEIISDIKDDDDIFNIFNFKQTENKLSKENIQKNIARHVDFLKIIWNKMIANKHVKESLDSNQSSTNIYIHIHFSEKMMQDIQEYTANSEDSLASTLNNYFHEHLKIKDEITIPESPNIIWTEQWYETQMFCTVVAICLVACGMVMKIKIFFMILFLFGVILTAIEIFQDAEYHKTIILTKKLPTQCDKSKFSWWKKLTLMVTSEDMPRECFEFEKDLHRQSHHSVNLLKVIPGIISDVVVRILKPIGHLTGLTYQGLSSSLPWYLAPFFLTLIIVVSAVTIVIITTKMYHSWSITRTQHNQLINNRINGNVKNHIHRQSRLQNARSTGRRRGHKGLLYYQ